MLTLAQRRPLIARYVAVLLERLERPGPPSVELLDRIENVFEQWERMERQAEGIEAPTMEDAHPWRLVKRRSKIGALFYRLIRLER